MIDFKQILPNWRVEIKEISNNVYQFIAKNGTGKELKLLNLTIIMDTVSVWLIHST